MMRNFCIAPAFLCFFSFIAPVEAEIVNLAASLSAANQNGSDPAVVNDPGGVVPTNATGTLHVQLDTIANTIDFQLAVDGILQSELRNFGPNATPTHLHLAGGGDPGNFGPIAIDIALNAQPTDFTNTATGFSFARNDVSILLADQGGVALGMHPGDDQIVDALQSGNVFILVHTTKDIFTNIATGRPDGFPFGEIRGNLQVIPEPGTILLLGVSLLGLLSWRKR